MNIGILIIVVVPRMKLLYCTEKIERVEGHFGGCPQCGCSNPHISQSLVLEALLRIKLPDLCFERGSIKKDQKRYNLYLSTGSTPCIMITNTSIIAI